MPRTPPVLAPHLRRGGDGGGAARAEAAGCDFVSPKLLQCDFVREMSHCSSLVIQALLLLFGSSRSVWRALKTMHGAGAVAPVTIGADLRGAPSLGRLMNSCVQLE
jgi:hypothetical protein